MKRLILFVIAIGQFACAYKKSADDSQTKNDTLQEVVDIDLTKSTNSKAEITVVDTLSEAEFIASFKEKTRSRYDIHKDKSLENNIEKSYDFWVGKKLLLNDTVKNISIWGYPKSFQEKSNGNKWVTTLGEGENHNRITLFTLDKYYNLIDNTTITSYGGDEGISSWILGEFKNDTTYLLKTFMTGYDTDSVENIINSCLIIHSNGKIEILENHQ